MSVVDCVVIGGGAAGLMCAAVAGKRGKSVLILDHANKVGKKILMSGGGRCNFTNYYIEPENYLCTNSHFHISALSRYTQYDFLALVNAHGLNYHEKTLGQLFCDNKAKDILRILLAECDEANVVIRTSCEVYHVEKIASSTDTTGQRFQLTTAIGQVNCSSLVIATGGLSIPTMGATGFGYDIAQQFGLRIIPRYAALVPFTFKGELLTLAQSLAGVAMPVRVECADQGFSEALLFTHKGVSGPAVLQVSNYWYPGDSVLVDFLPSDSLEVRVQQWKEENNKAELKTLLSRYLPKRFVSAWLDYHPTLADLQSKSIAHLSRSDIDALVAAFHYWSFVPAGTEGYKTAEVTRGGVNTDDVSSKTFEAKQHPGLFFVGEVLDVTGWLGGYNFQWAWASGHCAAQYV